MTAAESRHGKGNVMRHYIVIETRENEYVPETNPTTDDLIGYLLDAIAVRQGDIKAEASHHWWMRDATVRRVAPLRAIESPTHTRETPAPLATAGGTAPEARFPCSTSLHPTTTAPSSTPFKPNGADR